MHGARRGCLVVLLVLGLAAVNAADPPSSPKSGTGDKKPASPPAGPPAPSPPPEKKPSLDSFRLPADAVIVVCEKVLDAARMVPGAIVLPPRTYHDLLDELARLREIVAGRKASPPSACQISGRVEANLALLHVQFDFVTERPDALMALACNQGIATSASLDGRVPFFKPEAEGFTIQVEKPGEHQVLLDLAVPLANRAGARGIELALPRAALTKITLDLPAGARDVRVGGKALSETLLKLENGNRVGGGLGPADKLDVSWREPRPAPGAPLLVADGRVHVRLSQGFLSTEADLTLRAESGQTDRWQVFIPRGAELRVAVDDQPRLAGPVEAVDQPGGSLRTLKLREPSADPLRLTITTHGPAPKPGQSAAVGPFSVPAAARQSGLLLVSNGAPDLHLNYRTHGRLTRQWPLPEDDRKANPALVAAFTYGAVRAAEAPLAPGQPGAPGRGPWLELDAEAVRGQVRTRVTHELSLREDKEGLYWQVKTTLEATPRWADVDRLDVQLPAGWEGVDDTASAERPAPRPDRVVRLELPRASAESLRPVTQVLLGRFPERRKGPGEARLPLPRPLGAIDQGGEITFEVRRDLELAASGPPAPGLEPGALTPHRQTWRFDAAPEAVTVAWRPYVPDVRALSVADVTMTASGEIEVRRHELRLRLPQPLPDRISLRVPAQAEGLSVIEGGELVPSQGPDREVLLTRASSSDHLLVLKYFLAAGAPMAGGPLLAVPLVTVAGPSPGEARVRLWAPPGRRPALPDGSAWKDRPIEDVAGQPALPSLVVSTDRADAPLAIRWREPEPAFAVLAERALVRVRVTDSGAQEYTARFRLRRLAAAVLDIELPGPLPLLDLHLALAGKQVPYETVDDNGQPAEAGRIARLRLGPELVGESSILEVSYVLAPGRSMALGQSTGLAVTLSPPVLRAETGTVPVCWQVNVPASWVVLGPESGPGAERTWGWRGRLPALRLRPAATELAREWGDEAADGPPADVVCWRSGPEALIVTYVPQQAWLLSCSLVLVVLGLLLMSGRGGWARALLGVLFVLGLAAAAVLRPTLVAELLYGCEPGALVLVVLLVGQWLLHERYRRQIVFLPSFSRRRSGSSLSRSPAAPRAVGEPSTVDHQHAAGSGATR